MNILLYTGQGRREMRLREHFKVIFFVPVSTWK